MRYQNIWEIIENHQYKNNIIDFYFQSFQQKLKKQEFARLLREVKFYNVIEPFYFWTTKRKVEKKMIQSLVIGLTGGEISYQDLIIESKFNSNRKEALITGKKIKCSQTKSKQSPKNSQQDIAQSVSSHFINQYQEEQKIATNFINGRIELKLEIPHHLAFQPISKFIFKENTTLAEIQFMCLGHE